MCDGGLAPDLPDTCRGLCGNLRDFYLSSVSHLMNEVMQLLAIISTILIPLSFIFRAYSPGAHCQPCAAR